DMASGNRDKYKVSVKSTNMAGTYNVTIKDDCLIVLLDDGINNYNQTTDENGNIIKNFSYEYSASNPNSKYRLLQPDEYDFISLTMPKYLNTLDVYGNQKSFDYDVMLTIWDSEQNTTRIEKLENGKEYNTGAEEHIDLTGRNVKAIEIILKDVEGSLDNYTPEFEVEFNLKNDDTHGEYRSGTGSLNALAADPYGKLINFAMVYAEQTKDGVEYYYGESTENNNPPDRYNGYVDSNGAKFVYKDNNGVEYLTNTDGKNIYAIRSSADLFIRDPAVDVSTNTSYKKSNGAVIDLEKTMIDGITEATIKTAGQFYTELTSTLNMVPTEDTRFDKLIIRTVMPKVLADANGLTGSSKLSLSNVNIKNITLVENETSKPLTASDLINYYDRSNTYDNSIFNENNTPGQDYVEIITELDFSGKDAHIEIPKGVTGSISLTYPLFMNYATENNWKNQIDINDFYGATTAEIIPFSPMSITGNGNQGIQGSIAQHYKPNDTSKVQASSVAVNKLPQTASSWNEIAIKTVKSTLSKGSLDSPGTFGKYAEVNKWNENDTDAQKKMADYEYKLYFQMGNTEASRIFIYDNIEEAEDYDTALGESAIPSESKWKGTLKDVVVTGNETNLNTTGSDTTLKATVFYSTEKISSDLYLNENEYVAETDEQGNNDTRNTPEGGVNWEEASEYNGDLSEVKAFCVMVKGINSEGEPAHIAKAQEIYFTVQMTAPEKTTETDNSDIVNTDTYNKFTVRYARLKNDGSRDESFEKAFPNYPINSNHTTVTLRDTILKLKIVKTDMERENKWSADTHYMPISGAKFKIDSYDENNGNRTTVKNKLTNQDNQDYFETDEYGEITVNLAKGWYILTETDAPTGYRTANEIMFYVNATDENGNLKYSSGEEIPDLKLKNGNSFVPVDTNDENRNVFLKYTGSEKVYAENGNTVSMHTLQLEVADEIIPGKVKITKYDETAESISGEQKTVADVCYRLYKANGTKLGDPVYVTKETNTYLQDGTTKVVSWYQCVKPQKVDSTQNTILELKTDADGQIIITELPWGSFFLVEQSAPVGYEVPDTTDRSKYVSFSITPDLNTDKDKNYLIIDDVSAWDKETGLSVELTKYDWDDKTKTTKISNAEFNLEIYNPETREWKSWDGYHNKITQNGSITFTNGTMPVLAFGQKYRIVEINPAADYKKPKDPYSIEFDFTGDELDNTSGSPIYSEAYEVIRNEEDNSTTNVKVKKTISPVIWLENNTIEIRKVNVIKCEAENETNILSESEFQLTINENDRTVKADISMFNERKQSKLTIFKTDKDGNALAGAAFALYEVVGKVDSLSLDSKGNLQFDNYGGVIRTKAADDVGEDELVMSRKLTDAEGKIEIPDTLEWDKEYYLVEMTSPKGYKQN
ncbi:MAG: SpaA isopeptide-forming pilin-related protein, partial [Oscillospiraceae bacterium]|nr:SpaA isopeptide-forming pilin-related protein [Oscillospiraceae bacterium]